MATTEKPLSIRWARNFALGATMISHSILAAVVLALLFILFSVLLVAILPSPEGLLFLLGAYVVSLVFAVVVIVRRLWKQIGTAVHIFRDRIDFVRRKEIVAYRWGDIEEYYCQGVNEFTSTFGLDANYQRSRYHYRFRHRDKHVFEFFEKLDRNVEKPLDAYVEEGLLACRLPQLRQQFLQDGHTLTFGRFAVGMEGLQFGKSVLPWSEVDYVWAENGKVMVRKRGKLLNWCAIKAEKVPNVCLFLALAKERLEKDTAAPQ
jgi:hypothetical protein